MFSDCERDNLVKDKIPKIIHYCWFGGGSKPRLIMNCIKSWYKFCPDYKIIEWNETNFPFKDFVFAEEAFNKGKYAFVADVARFYVLKEMGGVYLDTDCELIKPIDPKFLEKTAFFSFESEKTISTALIASIKGGKWVGDMLDYYKDRHFILPDGNLDTTPNPVELLVLAKIKKDNTYQDIPDYFNIYPSDYFSPMKFTKNTTAIHWFTYTWKPKENFFTKGKTAAKTITHSILGGKKALQLRGWIRKTKSALFG
jgi:Mannosyltransferase OCH1 and related enzymes